VLDEILVLIAPVMLSDCVRLFEHLGGNTSRSSAIVAVASDAGKRGGGGLVADAAYAASKAGVRPQCSSATRKG
jgi:NAD(P)-dependent dehydrogenase (short-subunit alcohol dehydrogenase family)